MLLSDVYFLREMLSSLSQIEDKKMEAKMINTGKIISVLKIEEDDKKNTIKDIAVFEFVYHIKQIKNYGLRVI